MEDRKILISGASGNIGYEIIRGLSEIKSRHEIIAGDYKPENAAKVLAEFADIQHRKLDFADASTFDNALEGVDIVFLLRPPSLADVPKYFKPFMEALIRNNVSKIVFLSVQGVENQKFIPHYKIEKLIRDFGLDFVFLRPGYFMQNLATTLVHEIKAENKIFIPSGDLKFNWVDAQDIGLTGAHILNNFDTHMNKAFEITGSEFVGFKVVAAKMSELLQKNISYESPNLMKFFKHKRKLGVSKPMIFVMIMLHFLPRLKKNKARLTFVVKDITGKDPNSIEDYIIRDKHRFL